MLYAISGIMLCIALVRNKSKIVYGALILLMFILMAYSYGNADFSTYEMYFRIYGSDLSLSVLLLNNGLFKVLCALFTRIGLNYYHLLIFLTAVGFYNLHTTAKKFIDYKCIVFGLYFIYPFVMDITQVRNFVAMSFLLKGCSYLIDDDNDKIGIAPFIICNVISSLFHITFVFYFVLLLIKVINKKNLKYFAPILLAGEIVIFGQLQNIISILTNIEKTEFYFSKHIELVTLIIVVLYYLAVLFIVSSVSGLYPEKKWLSNIVKINLMLVLSLPVIYYSFEFIRLYRNIFFLNYIAVGYLLERNLKDRIANGESASTLIVTEKQLLFVAMLGMCVFSLYLFILHDYSKTVFIPTFEMNRLFNQP